MILYVFLAFLSYFYVRNAYFPQTPTKLEKFVSMILASVWLVSVPVTAIIRQEDTTDRMSIETSYDGFVGREA